LIKSEITSLQVRANDIYDGVEEGYDSSRDEISSVSSYNPIKEHVHRTFGSSLSLQSSTVRSSTKDIPYLEENVQAYPQMLHFLSCLWLRSYMILVLVSYNNFFAISSSWWWSNEKTKIMFFYLFEFRKASFSE
jgi:hypothetical protein